MQLMKLTGADTPADHYRELVRYWFAWASLRPEARTHQTAPYRHPRQNNGSFTHFLEWRWGLINLPIRQYRIDFSYNDDAATRALVLARQVTREVIEEHLGVSQQDLADRFEAAHQRGVERVSAFSLALAFGALPEVLLAETTTSTQRMASSAGMGESSARRILHALEQAEVLTRGTVRGHAVYTLTEVGIEAKRMEAEFGGRVPVIARLNLTSRLAS